MVPEPNVAGDVKLKAWVRCPCSRHYLGKDVDNFVLKDFSRIIQSSVGIFQELVAVSVTDPVVQTGVDNLDRVSTYSPDRIVAESLTSPNLRSFPAMLTVPICGFPIFGYSAFRSGSPSSI